MDAQETFKDAPQLDSNEPFDEDQELGGAMSFLEHLKELRERLIKAVVAMVVATVICFIFSEPLLNILLDAIPPDVEKQFEGPIAGLMARLKVSLLGGFFFAFPFIFWQAWLFIAPGLYKREKKFLLPLCLSTWACFLLGATFAYFVVFRFALGFLSTFGAEGVTQQWLVGNYLNFMIRFLLAFGLVFEEPVVILMLAKIGIVNSEMLTNFRSYAYVLAFVLAALITPPDYISQIACGLPLIILYEVSIWLVKMTERKKAEEEPTPEG